MGIGKFGVRRDKQFGMNNLDGKLIRLTTDYIAEPVCHVFNLSIKENVFPDAWKVAKIIPIRKSTAGAPSVRRTTDQSVSFLL